MQKQYKILLAVCAALLLVLPLSMLLGSLFADGKNALPDYENAEWFAITSATGEEYVFRPSDELFSGARLAFLSATPTDAAIEDARPCGFMTLDWIKDGRAGRYTLVFSQNMRLAVLTDASGARYTLTEADALLFLECEAGASAMTDEYPPALFLDGKEVSPAVLEWRASLYDRNGEEKTVSSGELLVSSVPTRLANASAFALSFETQPTRVSYSVFCDETLVCEGDGIPTAFTLQTGNYQLILVAEWETGNCTARAGYAIIFSVTS